MFGEMFRKIFKKDRRKNAEGLEPSPDDRARRAKERQDSSQGDVAIIAALSATGNSRETLQDSSSGKIHSGYDSMSGSSGGDSGGSSGGDSGGF